MATYYVYLMSNSSGTLYCGMTNDLERRVFQHKTKQIPSFTNKYNITRLMYYEETNDPMIAINREKEIKGWLREKKLALFAESNPHWKDLAADWFDVETLRQE